MPRGLYLIERIIVKFIYLNCLSEGKIGHWAFWLLVIGYCKSGGWKGLKEIENKGS